MKANVIALVALLAVAIAAVFCWQPTEAASFAITEYSCEPACNDGTFDWGVDEEKWTAEGTLGSFLWASRYSTITGIRHVALEFDGFGVAQLVTNGGYKRLVGPGSMCLATTGGRAFVVIRGFGEARAVYEDGFSNGCWGNTGTP